MIAGSAECDEAVLRRGEAGGDTNGSTADIRAERPPGVIVNADGRERECHRQGAILGIWGATAVGQPRPDGSTVHGPAPQPDQQPLPLH